MKNKIIIYLFFAGLIFSCGGGLQKRSHKKDGDLSRMWTNVIPGKMDDSLLVKIYVQIPNSQLVFIKGIKQFHAEAEFTLIINDLETEKQLIHESWKERKSENYYEDTRETIRYIESSYKVNLMPGEYQFLLTIRDTDSYKKLKLEKSMIIGLIEFWSELQLKIRENHNLVFTGNRIPIGTDSIFCTFFLNNSLNENNKLMWNIKKGEEKLDSGTLQFTNIEQFPEIILPIGLKKNWGGNLELQTELNGNSQTLIFNISQGIIDQYFNDIDYWIGVHSIILSIGKYKTLKKMETQEKWEFLSNYWSDRDPTPNTEFNELLDEFYSRTQYTNDHFGVLIEGWRSDRGRIYIKYGPPSRIDTDQKDRYGRNYLIWYYDSNKEIIYIGDGFGDYRLVREVN